MTEQRVHIMADLDRYPVARPPFSDEMCEAQCQAVSLLKKGEPADQFEAAGYRWRLVKDPAEVPWISGIIYVCVEQTGTQRMSVGDHCARYALCHTFAHAARTAAV